MELVLDRDDEAERLLRQYTPLLTTVVTAIFGRFASRENVEDCVHAVIWEYLRSDNFDASRGSEKTYLCVMARSRALTAAKALAAQSAVPLDEVPFLSAPDELAAAELRIVLTDVLDALKPPERKLFTLRYLYQLPTKDIADRLGTSQTSVTTRLSRLRKKLAQMLLERGIHLE